MLQTDYMQLVANHISTQLQYFFELRLSPQPWRVHRPEIVDEMPYWQGHNDASHGNLRNTLGRLMATIEDYERLTGGDVLPADKMIPELLDQVEAWEARVDRPEEVTLINLDIAYPQFDLHNRSSHHALSSLICAGEVAFDTTGKYQASEFVRAVMPSESLCKSRLDTLVATQRLYNWNNNGAAPWQTAPI